MSFEARPLLFAAHARSTLAIRPCFPLRLSAEGTDAARCEAQGKALIGYACGNAEASPECAIRFFKMRAHAPDGYADLKAPAEGKRP